MQRKILNPKLQGYYLVIFIVIITAITIPRGLSFWEVALIGALVGGLCEISLHAVARFMGIPVYLTEKDLQKMMPGTTIKDLLKKQAALFWKVAGGVVVAGAIILLVLGLFF